MQNGFKTLIRKVYYSFDKFSIILIERSKKKCQIIKYQKIVLKNRNLSNRYLNNI